MTIHDLKQIRCSYCNSDLSTTIGFYSNWDDSVVWCPKCGERLRSKERRRDEAIAQKQFDEAWKEYELALPVNER